MTFLNQAFKAKLTENEILEESKTKWKHQPPKHIFQFGLAPINKVFDRLSYLSLQMNEAPYGFMMFRSLNIYKNSKHNIS